MKIAGLDIGTTGCKCTVFDENGIYLGKAYRDYPVRRAVSGHEIDVSVMMDGVYGVLSEMAGLYPDIAAIGVTSFGETFVMTDACGKPLHTAMLYTDPRGAEECRALAEHFGELEITKRTGLRPHEMYSISKMMWLKRHCPEIYEKTAYIFLMEDFIVYHLTGKRQIDYSIATRTMAFDIQKLDWDREILDFAEIDANRLSKPVPTGTDAGTIRAEAAERTGLSMDTHIVSISHDQVAAAVGAGVFDSATAVDGAGTVECVTPIFDSMPDIDTMYRGYFSIVPYVIPGKYVAYAFSYTGGALMQWCTDTLAKKEKELAAEMGMSVNEYLEREYRRNHSLPAKHESECGENQPVTDQQCSEATDQYSEATDTQYSKVTVQEEPTGLLVLPHFAGAATPYMDTGSKGAILGLTTATTTAEIYRACMEGVAYEMLLNIRALEGSGSCFTKLSATGGGAHSKVWMQMKADVLNLPITALATVDAGTVGSAMLTGVAIGVFKDLADAAAHMVEETETYYPRADMHEKYMQIYARYEQLYKVVRPLME